MNKLNIPELFARAGLKHVDGLIYESLDDEGMVVMEISRATDMHRPAIYASLKRLEEKGLIEKGVRGKRTVYVKTGGAKLHAFIKGVDVAVDHALEAFPVNRKALTTGTTILEGVENIKLVLEWLLIDTPHNGIFYRFSSRDPDMKIESYMPSKYRELRDKKKVQQFVICSERLAISSYQKRMDCASKFIPSSEDVFEHGVNILIYEDKVAYVNFEKLKAYIIRDQNLADVQRAIFKVLYKRL